MQIDILTEDPRWVDLGVDGWADAVLGDILDHLGMPRDGAILSVLLCDDARIATLNADFRGKPHPTNVLSWPAQDLAAGAPGAKPPLPQADPDGSVELGDIALAFETCQREAAEQKKTADVHIRHLFVHGTLHLLGYDHENEADAGLMEGLEREILGKMGIDDPYME